MSATHQKRSRLSRAEIGEIMKHGARAQGALCSYVYRQRVSGRAVAVVVSKKVSKTAVGRNRLKRRIREAYWSLPGLPLTPSGCVVIAKVSAVQSTAAQLREEFTQKLVRAV
jgi:ribonuclease P protein component